MKMRTKIMGTRLAATKPMSIWTLVKRMKYLCFLVTLVEVLFGKAEWRKCIPISVSCFQLSRALSTGYATGWIFSAILPPLLVSAMIETSYFAGEQASPDSNPDQKSIRRKRSKHSPQASLISIRPSAQRSK